MPEPSPHDEFSAHFERGVAAYRAGRVDESIAEFQAAVRLDPRNAPSRYNLALRLESKGRYAEAAAELEAFLACANAQERKSEDAVRARVAALKALVARKPADQARTMTLGGGVMPLEDRPPDATLTMGGAAETLTLGAGTAGAAPEAAALTWAPGSVIDDVFEVRAQLGEGGFGTVQRVFHRGWGMDLAVKAPRADRVASRRALEGFVQEANTWVGLGMHPHVVTCYFVRLMGVPRIFIEYMEGGSLADWLREGRVKGLPAALDAAIQAARAMEYAHSKGLVHRDLKPGNCLMTPAGALKVTDFGLAKVGDADEGPEPGGTERGAKIAKVKGATHTGRLGTPEYMAPEQWERPREAGRSADVWAFGAMLYELCLGRRPFEMADGEPSDSFYARLLGSRWGYAPPPAELPKAVRDIVVRCLDADPARRPDGFKGLAAALEAAYVEAAGKPYPRPAAKEPPLLADTLVNQGVSMADLGRSDEALRLFGEAFKLDPRHPGAVYDQGMLHVAAGRLDAAAMLGPLGDIKRSRPDDWVPPYLLGLTQAKRGDKAAALKELDEALALSRGNALAARARRLAEGSGLDGRFEMFVAPPRGVEGAGLEDAAFKSFMRRAAQERDAGEASKAYETVMRARGVKGYEHAGEALDIVRVLALHGARRGLKGGWHFRQLAGSSSARALAISADGRHLLSGHDEARLVLWESASGKEARALEGHSGAVNAVAFTPDGKGAVSAGDDGALKLFELATGRCLNTFAGHRGPVNALAVTPDGKTAVSGGADKLVGVWDLAGGAQPRTLRAHEGPVRGLGLSLDGGSAVSSSEDKTLRRWELGGKTCSLTISAHEGPLTAAALSPDWRHAVSAGKDLFGAASLKLWELPGGRLVKTTTLEAGATAMGFTPDGRFLLVGREDGVLEVRESPSLEVAMRAEGHGGRIAAVAVSPDGSRAFTAGADGVRCWELDWELTFPSAQDWDDGARPYARAFMDRRPSPGAPLSDDELRDCLSELGRRGYGWLSPAGVKARLETARKDGWGKDAEGGGLLEAARTSWLKSPAGVGALVLAVAMVAGGIGFMLKGSGASAPSSAAAFDVDDPSLREKAPPAPPVVDGAGHLLNPSRTERQVNGENASSLNFVKDSQDLTAREQSAPPVAPPASVSPGPQPEDFLRECCSKSQLRPGDPAIAESDFRLVSWEFPRNIRPGMGMNMTVTWETARGNPNAVVYVTAIGNWNPEEPLALLFRGYQGRPGTRVTKTFTFQAPTKPGDYMVRWILAQAFKPITRYYSKPDGGADDPGNGTWAQVEFRVGDTSAQAPGQSRAVGQLRLRPRGFGEMRDAAGPAQRLQRACIGGSADDCARFGLLYENGQGVAQDMRQAFFLYERACKLGSNFGCTNLGVMYEHGTGGESKSLLSATALYNRGCEMGDAHGCSNLGGLLDDVQGVSPDYNRAFQLDRKACDMGDASGCRNLGVLYVRGHGVGMDLGKAGTLYHQACGMGDGVGCQNEATLNSLAQPR